MTINKEKFLQKVIDIHGDVYEFLEEFINMTTKIQTRHKVCGYTWPLKPTYLTLKSNIGKIVCPQCNGVVPYTQETFAQKVFEASNGEIIVTGTYVNNKTPVMVKHFIPECGHEWPIFPQNIMNRGSCLKCSGRMAYTTESLQQKVNELTGENEYIVVGECSNNRDETEFLHNACGRTFSLPATYFTNSGSRCPFCTDGNSKGEKAIADYLISKNITFIPEYTFPDCRNINTLPFDVAVFENNQLIMLIEFDGKQHFEPIEWFGGEYGFQQTQLRDNIKNNYCISNNIPLLRVPYWVEENINNILDLAFSERSSECSFFIYN